MTDQQVHGLGTKLLRHQFDKSKGLTHRESWLLDACISELEWRARADRRRGIASCTCQLCFGPFEDGHYDGGPSAGV